MRGAKVQGSSGGVVNFATVDVNPANNATTYIFLDLTGTPVVASNTTGFPASNYFPICIVVKDISGRITSFTDSRPDSFMVGAGGSQAGNTGGLQNKGTPPFQASGVNDDGTTLSIARYQKPSGTNPYVDVRAFGVRAFSASTTGSIKSGNRTLTIAGSSGFQNGDGIVVRGAGTTNTLSTPSAPTVIPSNPSFLTGTGQTVASASGATTYQYCYAAVTTDAQMTPCSPTTSISTGQATLGPSGAISISSVSASGSTITVTTSTPHAMGQNAQLILKGTGGFDGWYRAITVPDNTHFTVVSTNSTANGAPTSGSTGTVQYWNSNRITLTAVTNAWKYAIYGRKSGSMAFIGWALPNTTLTTVSTYLVYEDYGSTMSSPPNVPDWVPSVPPIAAKNGDLVTTVASGGGTTYLTLSAAATNTVAGATVKFDNAPNIVAAITALQGQGKGILMFPAAPGSSYNTNSVVNVPFSKNAVSIQVLGAIALGDSFISFSSVIWSGQPINPDLVPQFGFQHLQKVTSATAWPVFFNSNNANTNMGYLKLEDTSPNQALIFLDDSFGTVPRAQFDHMQFVTSGASDYMSLHYVARGTAASAGFFFRQCQFFSGPTQVIGATATPLIYFDGGSPSGVGGTIKFENTFANRRGMAFSTSPTGLQIDSKWHYIQGGITPLFSIINNGSNSSAAIRIENFILDTTQEPLLQNAGGYVGVLDVTGGVGPTPGTPLVTQSVASSSLNIALKASGIALGTNLGQNAGTEVGPLTTSSVDGIKSNASQGNGQKQFNVDLIAGNRYQYAVVGLPMAAPTVTGPMAGGSIPIGTNTYAIAPVGTTGGEIAPISSATNTCVTTSGKQTCSVNWVAYPGAIGYNIYRNNFSGAPACTSPNIFGGLTTSAVLSAGGCGQGAPNGPGSGLAGISAASVFGPSFVLSGNGFKTTFSPGTATANRTLTTPDIDGQLVVSPTGAVFGNNHLVGTGSTGKIIDLGVAPPQSRMVASAYTNATTTATNITGLSFSVAVNVNYAMRCDLYYQGSTTTAGLDITLTGPASPKSIFYSYDESATATSVQSSVANTFATKLTGKATVTAITNQRAVVTMGLRNGANAGTVQVQGSATGAGAVTVQPGSFCTLQ